MWEYSWNQFKVAITPNIYEANNLVTGTNTVILYLKRNIIQNITISICSSVIDYRSLFIIGKIACLKCVHFKFRDLRNNIELVISLNMISSLVRSEPIVSFPIMSE